MVPFFIFILPHKIQRKKEKNVLQNESGEQDSFLVFFTSRGHSLIQVLALKKLQYVNLIFVNVIFFQ